MMQVENEYGYYGDDKKYFASLLKIYRENGIDNIRGGRRKRQADR